MWTSTAAIALTLVCEVAGIAVAPGSPCESKCGNVLDSTSVDHVVCRQEEFMTETAGIVYQECVTCQQTSNYYSKKNETDVEALLYNLRYAFSHCLYGVPENDHLLSTICMTSEACGPFREAITYNNLTLDFDGNYGHCERWPVTDARHVLQCTECLRVDHQYYMANFFTALQAGCEQHPEPGLTLGLDGSFFSEEAMNITEPSPLATVNPEWFDQGPLDLSAKAGIAAGGAILLLAIGGFIVIWRGKRRRRAFLQTYQGKKTRKHWPKLLIINKEMSDTPLSQKPLRSWDESPQSARSTTDMFPKYFSPYNSHFSSPVSAQEANVPQWPVLSPRHMTAPQQTYPSPQSYAAQQQTYPSPQSYPPPQHQNIGIALGGDDSSLETRYTKGKGPEESYEMQNVSAEDLYSPPQESNQPTYYVLPRGYGGMDRGNGNV